MVTYEEIKGRISRAASGHGESIRLPLGEVKIWRSPLPMGGPLAPPAGDDEVVRWSWSAAGQAGPVMACTREQAWRYALDLYNAQADAAAAGEAFPAQPSTAPDPEQVIGSLRDRIAELEREALHPRIEGNPYAAAALKAVAAARASQMIKWPISHDAGHDAGDWLAIVALPLQLLATAALDKAPGRALVALVKLGAVAVAAHESLSRQLDAERIARETAQQPGQVVEVAQVVVTNEVKVTAPAGVEPAEVVAAAAQAALDKAAAKLKKDGAL